MFLISPKSNRNTFSHNSINTTSQLNAGNSQHKNASFYPHFLVQRKSITSYTTHQQITSNSFQKTSTLKLTPFGRDNASTILNQEAHNLFMNSTTQKRNMSIVQRRKRMLHKIMKKKQKEENLEKKFSFDSGDDLSVSPIREWNHKTQSLKDSAHIDSEFNSLSISSNQNVDLNTMEKKRFSQTNETDSSQPQQVVSPAAEFMKPIPGKEVTEFSGFKGFEQPENPHLLTASVIGVPNAGKSTLLNALIGAKVAATSPKVQTTRNNITGVFTQDNTQVCFVDTPGVVPPERQKKMMAPLVEEAWRTLNQVDVVFLVINASKPLHPQLRHISKKLQSFGNKKPVIVLNKVDLVRPRERWLEIADELSKYLEYRDIFYTSALLRKGVDIIKDYLVVHSQPGEWIYDPNVNVEMSPLERVEEIIREKIFRRFNKEVPYYATQSNRSWIELNDGSIKIEQDLKMATTGQMKMAIAALTYLKGRAKKDIELALGKKVHLFFRVMKMKKKKVINRTSLTEEEEDDHFGFSDD
eukprot:gb/GECH01013530.1/.p1 GENE.gb/GECH01013530.1/~~gb/GECH01013530.1/.p1  ORF type:complete len:526 (+),score=129.18 gb/GECH01013530.1/:1-1578(+)